MTATEPTAAPAAPPAPAEPPFAVTRADWQRLLDRVAEQEATIRQLQQRVGELPAPGEPQQDRPAGTSFPAADPHVVEAAEAYYAELDDLLAHLAAHPQDRWVGYRGRERVGFGPTGYALHQRLEREYPDGRFHVLFIDANDKGIRVTVF
jgi:hypothetical protein